MTREHGPRILIKDDLDPARELTMAISHLQKLDQIWLVIKRSCVRMDQNGQTKLNLFFSSINRRIHMQVSVGDMNRKVKSSQVLSMFFQLYMRRKRGAQPRKLKNRLNAAAILALIGVSAAAHDVWDSDPWNFQGWEEPFELEKFHNFLVLATPPLFESSVGDRRRLIVEFHQFLRRRICNQLDWFQDRCKQDKANHVADLFIGQKRRHEHLLTCRMCLFLFLPTLYKIPSGLHCSTVYRYSDRRFGIRPNFIPSQKDTPIPLPHKLWHQFDQKAGIFGAAIIIWWWTNKKQHQIHHVQLTFWRWYIHPFLFMPSNQFQRIIVISKPRIILFSRSI